MESINNLFKVQTIGGMSCKWEVSKVGQVSAGPIKKIKKWEDVQKGNVKGHLMERWRMAGLCSGSKYMAWEKWKRGWGKEEEVDFDSCLFLESLYHPKNCELKPCLSVT